MCSVLPVLHWWHPSDNSMDRHLVSVLKCGFHIILFLYTTYVIFFKKNQVVSSYKEFRNMHILFGLFTCFLEPK